MSTSMTGGTALFDTPVGACGLGWGDDGRLRGCCLPEADPAHTARRLRHQFPELPWHDTLPPAMAVVARRWLAVLTEGSRDTLADVALNFDGHAPFHVQVWQLARQIPPGQTRSYGEMARLLDQPPAMARAVGQALGRNPFAPIVPCHRILAAGGLAGGFSASGGVPLKLQLLQLEGAGLGAAASPDQPGLF
ncbi:methylated-DNA--[protein]-cysteine S-methyltransferase [Ideonella azotifigens]|nr:methylated-DNA--[protein]-cysteine S-methyltransferase [Ideonella azotifigens]MCD2340687.1 methylated-DNA--[protein]-cysteine S-methyltransferase [Ideonella azotifigens]